MSIVTGAVRIFAGWGKTYDITTTLWKDAWTYVCAALDGTWGRQLFSSPGTSDNIGTVFNTGYQTHWSTTSFIAANTSISLVIPVQSFEDYPVMIYNLTDNSITCTKILAGSSTLNCNLIVGNEYHIISTEFLLKTK